MVTWLAALLLTGCPKGSDTDDTADVDTDVGTDVDTDVGTDVDTDAGTDGDTDPDTASPPPAATQTGSLYFDGIDDLVALLTPVVLEDPDALTVEVWIRPERVDPPEDEMLVTKGGAGPPAFSLFRTHQENVNFERWEGNLGCGTVLGDGGVAAGDWYHVAATWSSVDDVSHVYLDGQLVDSSACTRGMVASLDRLLIGASEERGVLGGFFQGHLDEVRVWDVQRSQAQIQATMNQTLTGVESGLVVYLPFEEGTGDTTANRTGTTADATLGAPGAGGSDQPTWSDQTPF